LYRKHQFHYIWYSNNRVNEFGNLLHNKLSNLEEEGIQDAVPYKDKLDRLYEYLDISQKSSIEPELHSALYFFYTDKVYHGLNTKINRNGMVSAPKETIVWYVSRLLLIDPNNKQR
jgi:ATP-dependent exoDNAse (exonuclease V) beta subunit